MLDIKVHGVLDGMFLELLHAVTVFGVDSVEHQIESGIRFIGESEDSAGLFRPNEFATNDFPSKRSRMAQFLSLLEVLPPSLQVSLLCLQIGIRLPKRIPSLSTPSFEDAKCPTKLFSGSVPATAQDI
jgi:hypothetical protein